MKVALIEGNAADVLKKIDESSVDMIVTSPPYFGLREMITNENLKKFEIGTEKNYNEYINTIIPILEDCMRVLKWNGNMFLNIGDKWVNGQKLFLPYRIAIELGKKYIVREDIIWVKKMNMFPGRTSVGSCTPHPVKNRFLFSHDVILHITKTMNNKSFLERIKTKLAPCTIRKLKNLKDSGKKTKYTNNTGGNIKKGLGTWNIQIKKGIQRANPCSCIMFATDNRPYKDKYWHNAKFPNSLPGLFIEGFTEEGDVVLDPFVGSGTTMERCCALKRNGIGVEINPKFVGKIRQTYSSILSRDVFLYIKNTKTITNFNEVLNMF